MGLSWKSKPCLIVKHAEGCNFEYLRVPTPTLDVSTLNCGI